MNDVCDADFVEKVLDDFWALCARHRRLGGIALEDAFNGTVAPPEGWVLDRRTYYYLPPELHVAVDNSP